MYDDWMQYIPTLDDINEEKIKNRYKWKDVKHE